MKSIAAAARIPEIADRRPVDRLARILYEADVGVLYNQFYTHIHKGVEFFRSHNELERHHDMLNDFLKKFDTAFSRWRNYLASDGTIPQYSGDLMDLLYLGLWDSSYCNDKNGELSPFGSWLASLGSAMEGKPIGIFHAFIQQLTHLQKENLVKAQQLAINLYDHFLGFIDANEITALKPDYEHPPLIQLYTGGAATWLSDLPVPTIIAMSELKADKFSGFSALPHEFGHDVSGTFKCRRLVNEIIMHVKNLELRHSDFWQLWIEECFALLLLAVGSIYIPGAVEAPDTDHGHILLVWRK